MTKYETRFTELPRRVAFLIPTEAKKARRFINGLTYGIRVTMAQELGIRMSFQHAVEIAQRIEHVRI